MKALIGSHETWKMVEDGYEEQINTINSSNAHIKQLKEAQVKDKVDLYIFYQVVDEFSRNCKYKNFKKMWDIIEKAYKGMIV